MTDHFRVHAVDGSARTGTLRTAHGPVQTPAFMPVATLGSVKALAPDDLSSLGADILLANAYHLMLQARRPAGQRYGRPSRLHGLGRPHSDRQRRVPDLQPEPPEARLRGTACCSSPTSTAASGFLSPEAAIEYQGLAWSRHRYGAGRVRSPRRRRDADAPGDGAHPSLGCSMQGEPQAKPDQHLFGIVQGGISPDMRLESAAAVTSLDFYGYAVGGLSVGEPKADMYRIVSLMGETLPADKPRYLMGVGSPEDLVECIARGMDMFDCSLPTRVARNGGILTRRRAAERGQRVLPRGQTTPWTRTATAIRLSQLLRRLHPPPVQGKGASGLPPGVHPQPAVSDAADGRRPPRHRRGQLWCVFRDGFIGGYRTTDEEVRRSQKDKWLEARRRGDELSGG